ncbi:adenylyltransferase/cytidyltransferase family protein [Patescibacteria group bacterium]|nr:adenylyltransferase/cytidyltransferase family protein [Patescibacteria group bacterium]HOM77895.1 adenylyltransferase/cytidyltransferase family protein [bacterium]
MRNLKPQRLEKYLNFSNLQPLSKRLKKEGKKIVFTIGSFDLLNPGHCRYLTDAKAAGDVLVVGVSSDSSDRRVKGPNFPLIPELIRAELLTYLRTVDYITIVDNDRPQSALIVLQPDTFFTCEYDWKNGIRTKEDQVLLDMYGGGVFIDTIYEPYFSAGDLIYQIANIRFVQILKHYLSEKFSEMQFNFSHSLKPVDFGFQTPRNLFAFNANKLIFESSDLENLSKKVREEGKKVVFVSGTYDLLHVGHARFIENAAKQGDFLVVGIPSDEAVRKLKGEGRPVISENSRAYVLASLDIVDAVVIFPEVSVLETLKKLQPDIFYTVRDSWNTKYRESPEYRLVTSYGGSVICGAKQSSNISASSIIDKLAYEKVCEIFKDCMDAGLNNEILKEESKLGRSEKRKTSIK